MAFRVAIIGGGASGFFAAINIAQRNPQWQVHIYEKSADVLQKVRISGGGRCNVTHHCFEPARLTPNYPRGEKQLYSIFKQFNPQDTIAWFAARGVELKTEADGRMFPLSNVSSTIIDCFLSECQKLGIKIHTSQAVKALTVPADSPGGFVLDTTKGTFGADRVVLAAGSSGAIWKMMEKGGLRIVPPVPSLFTFHITDDRLKGLMGLSFPQVTARIASSKFESSGPLLITHWGLSGPAILKLSAFAARHLADLSYKFELLLDLSGGMGFDKVRAHLQNYQKENPKRQIKGYPLFDLPRRWWERMTDLQGLAPGYKWEDAGKKVINKLAEEISQGRYMVTGKSTFKEEFVTAGGIALNEVNLKTMECKKVPGLYITGEVLDIDAITGGFNFQSCWSTAWLAAQSMTQ